MVLDQLKFLTSVHVERNYIPRRLIPKIRKAIKVFSDKRPKLFAQYGKLIITGVANDWLITINSIVEHYYTIEDTSKTSLGTFVKMALCLARSKYWLTIKAYDCDGFFIPAHKDGITLDHAVIFVDGVIALKVETRNGKYFIADYFIGSMNPYIANEISYLWYDHGREHFE